MSEPFAYEEYRKKKVKDKMDEKRKSRISLRSNLPKVRRRGSKPRVVRGEGEEEGGCACLHACVCLRTRFFFFLLCFSQLVTQYEFVQRVYDI